MDPNNCWFDQGVGLAPVNTAAHMELEAVSEFNFPKQTAAVIDWRLMCLELWPMAAQAKLDEQKAIYETRVNGGREALNLVLDSIIDAEEPDPGISPTVTMLIAGGSFVLGVALCATVFVLSDEKL